MSYFLIIGVFYYLAVSALAAPGSTTFTKLNLHIEAHTDNQTIYHGYTAHRFTIHHSGTGKRVFLSSYPAQTTLKITV